VIHFVLARWAEVASRTFCDTYTALIVMIPAGAGPSRPEEEVAELPRVRPVDL
jgi:hypothetical protein